MLRQSCLLRGAGDRRRRPFAVGSPPYEGGRGEGRAERKLGEGSSREERLTTKIRGYFRSL